MIPNHDMKKRRKKWNAIQEERYFLTGAAMRIQKKRDRVKLGNHREEQTSVFCLAQQVSIFQSVGFFSYLVMFWDMTKARLLSFMVKLHPRIPFLSASVANSFLCARIIFWSSVSHEHCKVGPKLSDFNHSIMKCVLTSLNLVLHGKQCWSQGTQCRPQKWEKKVWEAKQIQ